MQTKINWFEIPSADFARAVRFYETVFDTTLKNDSDSRLPMAIFTAANGAGFGCVLHGDGFVPGANGPVLYLDATPSFDAVLTRVPRAGGRILLDKMELPRNLGYVAHFLDSEGNRVALHAQR